jgi:hypothetical protein
MKNVFIYSLSDPNTLEIRYIGKANDLNYRYWAHLHEAKNDLRNQHKCNWIKKLLKEGKKPIIEVVEEVPFESWKDSEKFWIAQIKAWGFNLLNKTDGGECGVISQNCKEALKNCKKRGHVKGTFKHSEETKVKIREKRALQKITEEHKQKISQSLKGVKKTDDHKKSISNGKKGMVFTQEHRNKIAKSKSIINNQKSKK